MSKEEKIELQNETAQKLAVKFKLPMNVAEIIWRKLLDAGLNPLKMQSYASMLSTYMNIMDERIVEKAPPGGKYEDMIKSLKKKYPGDNEKIYSIAWAQYNKDNGK